MKTGPSNTYQRMLAGKITPERYSAIVARWARLVVRYGLMLR